MYEQAPPLWWTQRIYSEFPHCNSEVLHAPGTCQYCDEFPDRQAMRTASNTPFTPPEANGWYGNIAQPTEGIMETFLPAESELTDPARGWLGRILRNLVG